MKGSVAALVVFDITVKDSFERSKIWVAELKRDFVKIKTIILVGNKIDKVAHRKVSQAEAQEYADENEIPFREVSAKTGHGVTELFHDLAWDCWTRQQCEIKLREHWKLK